VINEIIDGLNKKGYPTFLRNYFYIQNHRRSLFQVTANLEIKEENTGFAGEENSEIIETEIVEFIRKVVFKYSNMINNSMLFNLKTNNMEYFLKITILKIPSKIILKIKPEETDFASRFAEKVEECIRDAGESGISLTGIVSKTQFMSREVRKNILQEKLDLGIISVQFDCTHKKRKAIYTWVGENE